jgi:hypothetical protein
VPLIPHASSSASSAPRASAKRSAGTFARSCRVYASSSGGTTIPGTTVAISGTGIATTIPRICTALAASNGRRPVSISKSKTPSA